MTNFNSKFLQELSSRGFISQITHESELDIALANHEKNNQPFKAYIGFDCTANTLHVGSLIQIMILRLLQKHGHQPLVLLGGGTTKIGDPSGKDEARQFLSEEKISENLSGIKKTLEKFISFENGAQSNAPALLVNNNDWLKNLNYLEFLRDVGRHFSVNRMLTFDSVKVRLERDQPLSFLEFNYMILQAYDFYVLNRDQNCALQIGGSDQWGNIVNGVELVRRMAAQNNKQGESFGLTTPLLTTSDGKKMGKTANGAVWLNASDLAPYDYFQFWRNTTDADTVKFLKLFTDLPLEEIAQYEKFEGAQINEAKEKLAFEATKICHGQEAAQQTQNKAREIFISGNKEAYEEKKIDFDGGKKLIEIMKEIGACASNGEARRLIEGGGVKVDEQKVIDTELMINQSFDLQIGKKKFYKITF